VERRSRIKLKLFAKSENGIFYSLTRIFQSTRMQAITCWCQQQVSIIHSLARKASRRRWFAIGFCWSLGQELASARRVSEFSRRVTSDYTHCAFLLTQSTAPSSSQSSFLSPRTSNEGSPPSLPDSPRFSSSLAASFVYTLCHAVEPLASGPTLTFPYYLPMSAFANSRYHRSHRL
jgi:hypothetical protein